MIQVEIDQVALQDKLYDVSEQIVTAIEDVAEEVNRFFARLYDIEF